jgi:molecular chaperone DnaK (HSP70)
LIYADKLALQHLKEAAESRELSSATSTDVNFVRDCRCVWAEAFEHQVTDEVESLVDDLVKRTLT